MNHRLMSASVECVSVNKLSNPRLMAVWSWIGGVSIKGGVSIVLQELESCFSYKNELVLAMEMVEDDCGFASVFIASNELCWGRI